MRNTITKRIAMTIAVAAMAVIGSIGMSGRAAGANAQTALSDGSVRFISHSVGIVPGNTLRFNVVNLNTSQQSSRARVSGHVMIFDSQGNVLAQSEERELPAGQFRSFDFKRDELPARGEAGTLRLQLRAELILLYSDSPEPISPDRFLVSMEVFDTGSGGDYFTGTVTVSGEGF